jgi:alpha-glucosidase
MTGLADPDCRRSFPTDRAAWDLDLLAYVRAAVAARAADAALRGDGYRTLAADGTLVAFERSDGARRSIVVANAGERPADLALPDIADATRLAGSLSTDGKWPQMPPAPGGGVKITIPARWAGIWRVAP